MAIVEILATLPQTGLIAVVRFYRLMLKPWIGNSCRFEPTCSAYALSALERHGALKGSLLASGRLLRCHPWCDGGIDPVPDRSATTGTGLFSRLGLVRGERLSKIRNPR